jgi:ribosomal protein S18 acetylase RimI-like enzyme
MGPDNLRLDNVVWHALRGPLARFSTSDPHAPLLHFDREVSIFSGIARSDESTWPTAAKDVGLEGFCGFFRDQIPPLPRGWEVHFAAQCSQMIAGDLPEPRGLEFDRLGADDARDMLALAKLTEPGPFALRTVELGRYVGLRREGRLVAMAGERFRIPGFVEVSGVCTHPDARGEGLAAELTLNVAQSIRERGDEAFLHVILENETAIRLYERIGFVQRRIVDVVFAQWHGPDWRPDEVTS